MAHPDEVFRPISGIKVLKKELITPSPTRPEKHEPVIFGRASGMSNEEALAALQFPHSEPEDESCYAQYIHYLNGYQGNIFTDTHAVLDTNPHLGVLMDRIAGYKEVVSVAGTLLYGEACNADKTDPTDSKHSIWYRDTIDHCAEALSHASGFIQILKAQSEDPQFRCFIDDFQQEIELLIADTVNLATGTAAHLTRGDCAVFIGELPVAVPQKANFGNILSLFGAHSGKGLTVYDKYLGGFLDYLKEQKTDLAAGKTDRTIHFPALVSAFDMEEFARLLNEFFESAETGLSAVEYDSQSDKYRLGEEIELSVKPESNGKSQPRINFQGTNRFDGFSLRIDKEDKRLALDIGGYGYVTLVKIGEAIAKATRNGESIMDYPQIVRDGDYRVSSRVLYTPVNQNPAMPKITQGEFMAYVAAFCMKLSHEMGIRKYASYFSYHSRSVLATEQAHHTHFESNATTLANVMHQLASQRG